jgi:hypothetical protein
MAPKEFKGLMNYLTRPSEDKKRQKGYFETNDPKEAAREIIKRVIPIDQYTFPITSNIKLGLGPVDQTVLSGEFDVGGGTLSVGGGIKGDEKAFGIGFRKQFDGGGPTNKEKIKQLQKKYNLTTASKIKKPDLKREVKDIKLFNEFNLRNPQADGGRVKFQDGLSVQTLNPVFPTKDPTSTDFKPLDLPGAIIPPLAIGAGAKRIKDIFFSKDDESKEDIVNRIEKIEKDKKDPNQEPPKLPDNKLEKFLIKEAVDRLKQKEMDKTKRDDRTLLARDLDLDLPKSGLYEVRKDENFFQNRLQTLKDKNVNFDGYYSAPEIGNLLGLKTGSGVIDFINRKNVPSVKEGLFKVVKLNDFLDAYNPTKQRIQAAPEPDVATKARTNFLSEVGGSFYQKFKDLRVPKNLPTEVKQVYNKYNLTEIEGGHPFPVEFFTKKFGKGNTLQKNRQFDWIYRNKNKLFDKNDLVFQSKDVNKLYRNKIQNLKKLYKELGPLVNKYEGKGAVKNETDKNKIANLNLEIMKIVKESEDEAKKFIMESPNSVDLPRMRLGGLHGALFNYETGQVSLYAPGKEAGFVGGSVGEIKTKEGKVPGEKLKLAGDYLDIVSQIIDNKEDKKIFTDYINKKILPRFEKGGPVKIDLGFAGGGRIGFESGTIPGGYTDDAYKYLREMDDEIFNSYKKYRAGGGKMKYGPFAYNAKRMMFGAFGVGQKKFAEGGGVKSGPPPESGPTPHGLPSLMKRGMKI